MKFSLRLIAALLAGLSLASGGVIEDAFQRLYNFDFAGSHRTLDPYIRDNPSDPLGHSTRAAIYLFSELDRLQVLAGEFLTDDKRISGDDVLEPNPVVRDKFFAAIAQAQKTAEASLLESPNDSNALFSFCLTEGMKTDYTAFIEKKQLRSLGSARKAHNYAVELIRRDPTFVDAHLTTGLTEYLVGSLPFFIRWFVRFEEVKGSK
ncbi:MAG: hypothetical protein JJE04_19835 [Acidobacteriia bacterium]|nr:hypothetical protein [Terriglobia bacterium]